jgi:hypothetical protein
VRGFSCCTLFAHKSYQRIITIRIIYKISIVTAMYMFWWRIENRKVTCAADPLALGAWDSGTPGILSI